jgi:hypothetical protein
MELIAHLLLTGAVFGFSLFLLIGAIMPDTLFLVAYLLKKNKKVHILGEYMHSVFIAPALLLMALLTQNQNIMMLGFGYGSHIITDMFVHKQDGSRYLYPLKKNKINSGLFYWKSKGFFIATYIILTVALIMRYRQ